MFMGYMIGVDGGGTGTVAVLTEEDGTILHSVEGPASNYHAVGRESAQAALRQVVTGVLKGAGKSLSDCKVAVFGIAGLNNAHDAAAYDEMISPIGLGGQVVIENDIVIAWAAATACEPGAVVIAGTGASAFGVNAKGERHKTLGWDYVVADQGSGYSIGLAGLKAAFKVWDGRIENSLILQAMIDHYQLKSVEEMLTLAYTPDFGKPEIASFAREIAACATAGDETSQEILRWAGDELAISVCAVIKKLGMENESFVCGLVGGTFRAGPHLLTPFTNRVQSLAPKVTIEPVRFPAVIGAILLAHYRNGSLTPALLEELQRTDDHVARWKSA
jgi:N-acetylglucosamine kinase-like BadF-type ATPase